MSSDIYTARGDLTAGALNLGYIQNYFGALRTVTLTRSAPGCDYIVTVQNGTAARLVARANFSQLGAARKYARAVLADLAATPTGGVSTL